jgi:isoquinoline 1-oxidoreductase beta subunit
MADGKLEIWTSVQSPGGARDDCAKRMGLDPKNVTLHCALLGGGFGRKSKWDFAIEAALLTKAMDGAPVKVVWTREDDIRHGFYHTVTAERLEAGLDKDNKVVAWRHRSAAPSLFANFMPDPKYPQFIELGMGFVDTPFNVPNVRLESGEAQSHVRVGWFRSVNNVAHAWAIQSFIAEIAHELGRDPKDMLLELIGPARIVEAPEKATTPWWDYGEPHDVYPVDTARLRRVTELVAEKAGWGKKLPPGHGLGIAAHRSFVTYVATIVEVAVDNKGNLTVPRVDTAVDCGFYVNPERIRSQTEGAAVMGLSLAKYGEITLKNGRVEQSNFNDYPVVRHDESPTVTNTHIVENSIDVPSSGLGEPVCRRLRPRSATPSSRRPASASAGCRSAISWRDSNCRFCGVKNAGTRASRVPAFYFDRRSAIVPKANESSRPEIILSSLRSCIRLDRAAATPLRPEWSSRAYNNPTCLCFRPAFSLATDTSGEGAGRLRARVPLRKSGPSSAAPSFLRPL